MGDWTNPCGGTRWRTLDSGLIEVEGRGTPAADPGTVQWDQLARTWQNFGRLFEREARRNDLPVSWLLAVATMETGGWSDDRREQATIVSPAGAIGVMQIMPTTARGFGRESSEMTDPDENIAVGAELLRQLARRLGPELPLMSAAYNSGRTCDTSPCTKCNEWNLYADGNYPGKVIRWHNAALMYELPGVALAGMGAAFTGVALALGGALVAWKMLKP